MKSARLVTLAATMIAACVSCSSSDSLNVAEYDKGQRVIGREHDVRFEAAVSSGLATGSFRLVGEVENLRPQPIVIYQIDPSTTFDSQSGTVTIHVGSELPVTATPILILSGEKKEVSMPVRLRGSDQKRAFHVRLLLHFVDGVVTAVDSVNGLDDWLRHKLTVGTSSVPMASQRTRSF